jgi:hypothetical protein
MAPLLCIPCARAVCPRVSQLRPVLSEPIRAAEHEALGQRRMFLQLTGNISAQRDRRSAGSHGSKANEYLPFRASSSDEVRHRHRLCTSPIHRRHVPTIGVSHEKN